MRCLSMLENDNLSDEQIVYRKLRMLRRNLLRWWKDNKRSYPWRNTRDPYKVLAAEVLLHRTRADQVVPLFSALMDQYPSITTLAQAERADLETLLRSAGLRWRVGLLLEMAGKLVVKHGGRVPDGRLALQALPGVGPYIAGAVRCFAFGKPDALLDTNTVRIAGRIYNAEVTDASRRSSRFQKMLAPMVDPTHPREFNFALLDLGALVCRPRAPLCPACPVRHQCAHGIRTLTDSAAPQ